MLSNKITKIVEADRFFVLITVNNKFTLYFLRADLGEELMTHLSVGNFIKYKGYLDDPLYLSSQRIDVLFLPEFVDVTSVKIISYEKIRKNQAIAKRHEARNGVFFDSSLFKQLQTK